ncbi:MAG: SHOCT domain-containing protein [Ardenticatenaceae bacterium]|nr:SHOCT domain-containing protein [Ardenticatenaceae bacterium]
MMMGFELVFVLAIGGAIAYALGWRPQVNQTGPAPSGQTALEILQARYVRGEIGRDEYDEIRRDLEA